MGYATGRNISKRFKEEKSPFTEEKCYCFDLSKRVYINLVHEFSFFLVVWSQSLKILACVKIGIKECYFFVYQMRLYLPHDNWFVLQLKQEVQGLQAFAFSTATDYGTTSAFQIYFNS